MTQDTVTNSEKAYRVDGHEFRVIKSLDGAEILRCAECLTRELLEDGDDPDDLLTAECRIEWLREPDGGFHGVALRNAQHFPGRQLISVKEDGDDVEVADTVRIYDDDAPTLASLLETGPWDRL